MDALVGLLNCHSRQETGRRRLVVGTGTGTASRTAKMGGEPSSSLQSAGALHANNASGGGKQGASRDDATKNSRDHNNSRNKRGGGRGKDDKPKAKNNDTQRFGGPSHLPVQHQWRVNDKAQPDERLEQHADKDPRGDDPTRRITKKKAGRNTESFDPSSTLVRPDLRVWVGNPSKRAFDKPLKHDDVVIVPELFGDEDDWDTYYKVSLP